MQGNFGYYIWLGISGLPEYWLGDYWSTSAPSDIVTYSNWRIGEGGDREKTLAFMTASDGTIEWIAAPLNSLVKHKLCCLYFQNLSWSILERP